ncbi:MAG: PdxA family dehydrogenase [Elusimicrobiota bacterium]
MSLSRKKPLSSAISPAKPRLAFTLGDPAGIGPEIAIKALKSGYLNGICSPLLIGEASIWKKAGWSAALAPLLDTRIGLKQVIPGRDSAASGQASFASLDAAAGLAARKIVDGIVTAPISKKAWALCGVPFRDHTEYFKKKWNNPEVQMILGCPRLNLWCVLASRHIPLSSVPKSLKPEILVPAAQCLNKSLDALYPGQKHKIGICALNPHAGEDGSIGTEEKTTLIPAVKLARRLDIDARGPIPADAAWRMHREGIIHGLVCLYHDQALIALKACAGIDVVNWTAGMRIVRVSPGHGTGFDIAGKNRADPAAIISAAKLAAKLCAT